MVEDIHSRFQLLASYTEEAANDPQRAGRIRKMQQQIAQFFADEGMTNLVSPRRGLLREFLDEKGMIRYRRYQNHLAAVAEEALRVEGEDFVHSSAGSIFKALRSRAECDPRVNPDYSRSSVCWHIQRASRVRNLVEECMGAEYQIMPISQLVTEERFQHGLFYVMHEGWIETLRNASLTLPADITLLDISYLLLFFDVVSMHKPVKPRIEAVRAYYTR